MSRSRSDHSSRDGIVEVITTDKRLMQLRDVLNTGAVRTIAYDPELAAAHAPAKEAAERFEASHPNAPGRAVFNRYRSVLGREVDIDRQPVHHRGFPMSEHREDITNPEKLDVTRPGNLRLTCGKNSQPVGSGRPAHEQLHEAYGGETLQDTKRKYETMAWGDEPEPAGSQLARWQAFQHPHAVVPLDEVSERIAAFNRMAKK